MGIAPLVAAWGQQFPRSPAAPYRGTIPSDGATSPIDFAPGRPLRIAAYLALGANLAANPTTWAWTDISSFVRYNPGISATTGRQDESATVAAGRASLTLDNIDGRFSRKNPTGAYWGLLSRNTPILVTINAGNATYNAVEMFVNEWPARWDKTQTNFEEPIVCAGVLRRLGQGVAPTKTLIRRTVEALTPIAYWPCSDGTEATQVASAVSGGTPLTAAFGTVGYGSVANADGTATALQLTNGTTTGGVIGTVPTGVSTTGWTVVCSFAGTKTTTGVLTNVYVLSWKDSQGAIYSFRVWADTLNICMVDGGNGHAGFPDGAGNGSDAQVVAAASVNLFDGNWHTLMLIVTPSAGLSKVDLYVDGTMHATSTAAGVLYKPAGGTIWSPDSDWQAPSNVQTLSIADIAVFDSPTVSPTTMYSAVTGYVGETATARLTRLCAEAGVPLTVTGDCAILMGAQPLSAFLDLLRECETADGGVLYEKSFGLGYQTRQARHNAAAGMALSITSGHIADDLTPADDDQRLLNQWTVTRSGGSSATATNAASVAANGTYSSSATMNIKSDSELVNAAGWLVHIGTNDDLRWPDIPLNFARTQAASLIDAWTALGFGARVTLAGIPTQVAPEQADVFVEGKTERFDQFMWTADLSTSPALVDDVFRVEARASLGPASNVGRLGLVQTLTTSIAAGDTSMQVTTPSGGALVTTAAGDFPQDWVIDGERVTVTAVSGSSSPQTATITRAVNGVSKAHTAGATMDVYRPGVISR